MSRPLYVPKPTPTYESMPVYKGPDGNLVGSMAILRDEYKPKVVTECTLLCPVPGCKHECKYDEDMKKHMHASHKPFAKVLVRHVCAVCELDFDTDPACWSHFTSAHVDTLSVRVRTRELDDAAHKLFSLRHRSLTLPSTGLPPKKTK